MSKTIEVFLRNIDEGKHTDYKNELAEEAQKGVYPCTKCDICSNPERCSVQACYPWFRWFQKKWKDIQKAAEEMK